MINKNKPEPKYLYLNYEQYSSGGEIYEGDEDSDYPSFHTEYIEVHFNYLHKSKPENLYRCEYVQVDDETLFDCKTLFLGVVFYSTGDTFTHQEGCWSIIGLYKTQEEAKDAIKQKLASSSYKVWEGYFDSYIRDEVFGLTVKD